MRETCPCCGAPCTTSTETAASPTVVRQYAVPEAGEPEGRVPSNKEMRLDMDVDDIKAAIGKAYPSIDDMTREILFEKVDKLHRAAFKALRSPQRPPEKS